MIWRLAWRRLAARPVASAVTASGLLIAVLGYLLLLGTARTTQATLSATIDRSWRGPYQLLVRPAGSQSALELSDGLIRPNFLSGLTGGITLAQLAAIRAVPGVTVAAPIALAGDLNWPSGLATDLRPFLDPGQQATLLRVTTRATGDAGYSAYPPEAEVRYLLAAPDGSIEGYNSPDEALRVGAGSVSCMREDIRLSCYGGRTPQAVPYGVKPGFAGLWVYLPQPLLVAGVDPAAEAALFGLDRCITTGRNLKPSDSLRVVPPSNGIVDTLIPAIFSERSFVDEQFNFEIDRLADPTPFLAGSPNALAGAWTRVGELQGTAASAYRAGLGAPGDEQAVSYVTPLWTVGDVQYRSIGADHLAALPQPPDPGIFTLPTGPRIQYVEPEATDTWFRPVTANAQVPRAKGFAAWEVLGRYDPSCLPGFDPLAGGRLDAYSVPDLRLPDGRLLGPTRSPAGYLATPPVALTTLEGARWFADPTHFAGRDPDAFISAVRIRVEGAEEPGQDAERMLQRVAETIHDRTGLAVDVVVGSSNRTIRIDLPTGNFGRPPLTLSEGWAVKGVGVRFTQALATQDAVLFTALLIGAFLLVSETAFVGVRVRREELGLLRALGWGGRHIAALVEAELLLLGLIVGVVAALAGAVVLVFAGGSGPDIGPLLLTPVVAVVVSGAAGLVAVGAALRRPASYTGRAKGIGGIASSPVLLAVRDLLYLRRLEVGLGASAIGLGALVLGTLLIAAQAFVNQLDFTVLGVHLAATVHPFHVVLALLTIVVGAMAGGEVVLLGYLEREQDFAALRALGWPRRAVLQVVLVQGLAIGLVGGFVGALLVFGMGQLMGAPTDVTARSTAAAALLAAGAAALAVAGPFAYAYRSPVAAALRGE